MRLRRRFLSAILVIAMLVSTVTPVMAAADEGEPTDTPVVAAADEGEASVAAASADLASSPVLEAFVNLDDNLDAKPMSRHWYPDAGAGLTQEQIDEILSDEELAEEFEFEEEYLDTVATMITELYEGGFGGVEMTMLADSADYSQALSEYIGWGTEAWTRVLAQALYTANNLEDGFKIDITMTAHWPLIIDSIDPNDDEQQQQIRSVTQDLNVDATGGSVQLLDENGNALDPTDTVVLTLPEQRTSDHFTSINLGNSNRSATFLFVDKLVGATLAVQNGNQLSFNSLTAVGADKVTADAERTGEYNATYTVDGKTYEGYAAGVPGTDYIVKVGDGWSTFAGDLDNYTRETLTASLEVDAATRKAAGASTADKVVYESGDTVYVVEDTDGEKYYFDGVSETKDIHTFGINTENSDGVLEDKYGRQYMDDWQYYYEVSVADLEAAIQDLIDTGDYDGSENFVLVNSYRQGTGQVTSGGETVTMSTRTYAVDYYSSEGVQEVIDYWDTYMLDIPVEVYAEDDSTVTVTLREEIQKNDGAIFEDSLELDFQGGTTWSPYIIQTDDNTKEKYEGVEGAFEAYMGYELADYLPLVAGMSTDDTTGEASRISADFNSLTSELFNDEHSAAISQWSKDVGFKGGYRYQSSNSLSQAVNVDIIESDNGTLSNYGLLKSSSTVNLRGDQYHSLEAITSTTLDPAYYETMLELNMNFSRGVNRVILHGTPYIQSANGFVNYWPGWAFVSEYWGSGYGGWNSRQAYWEDVDIFSDYVTRVQGLLQNATTKIPVMIVGGSAGTFQDLMDEGYHYNVAEEVTMMLDEADPDNIVDGVLSPEGLGTEAVVLYGLTSVSDVAFIERMIEYADAGVTVILYNTNIDRVSGTEKGENTDENAKNAFAELKTKAVTVNDINGLLDELDARTNNTVSYSLTGLEVTHLVDHADDTDYYFFYNYVGGSDIGGWGNVGTGLTLDNANGQAISETVTLADNGNGTPYLLDAYTGEITRLTESEYTRNPDGSIDLTLDIAAWDTAIVAVTENTQAFRTAGAKAVVKTEDVTNAEDLTSNSWDLTIESWGPDEAGAFNDTEKVELKTVTLSSGLTLWQNLSNELDGAYLANEAGITPEKIAAIGETKDAVNYLSGIGYYETEITWDGDADGAYLYFEHRDSSKSGDAQVNQDMVTQVTVTPENGEPVVIGNINPLSKKVDLGDALQVGKNTITIKLTTTLRNREWLESYNTVKRYELSSYGLTEVELVPYDVEETTDYSELQELVDEYSGVSRGIYTDDSWNTFQNALAAAENVLNTSTATQAQVNAAINALRDAYNGLTRTQLTNDTTVLEAFTDPDENTDAKPMSRHWYPDAGAGLTQAQIDEIKANSDLADELKHDTEYLYQVRDMINELYEGGFGGVEFTMLSDSAEYSQGMAEYIGWGSEAWVRIIAQALYTANETDNGFKIDVTATAHWPLIIDTIDPNDDAQQQQMSNYVQALDVNSLTGGTLELELPEQRNTDYFSGFGVDRSATFLFVDKWVGTTIAIQNADGSLEFDSLQALDATTVSGAGYPAGVPSTDYIINVDGHWEEFSGTPTQAQLDSGEVVATAYTDTFGINILGSDNVYRDENGREYMDDWQSIYQVSVSDIQSYISANPLDEDQEYVLVNSYRQGTGQVVSGGEAVNMDNRNYTIDYYNEAGAQAVIDYWEDRMLDLEVDVYDNNGDTVSGVTIRELLQDNEGALFEDSLEMHITNGTGWSANIVDEFEDYMGYDLAQYLPVISGTYSTSAYSVTGDEDGLISRINTDFTSVKNSLFNDNHSGLISTWAKDEAGFKGGYRYQSSNSMVQALNADIIESDNGTQGNYGLLKSSSTVNLRGDQYHSMEALTITTLDPAYYDTMLELNMNFSRGINRVILHGTPFVQSATGKGNSWPGWAFNHGSSGYGAWNSRQAYWDDIAIFSDYVTRVQGLMQQGTTKIPVLFVGGSASTFSDLFDNGYHYNVTEEVTMMQDYASPDNIENGVLSPEGLGTELVVLSGMNSVDDVAFIERMIEYAEAGVTVALYNTNITKVNGTEKPGNTDADAVAAFARLQEKATTVDSVADVLALADEVTNNTVSYYEENLEVTHLVDYNDPAETDYYFFYNYQGGSSISWGGVGSGVTLSNANGQAVSTQVTLAKSGSAGVYLMDAYTGEITEITKYTDNGDGTITLTLDIPAWDSAIVAVTEDTAFADLSTTSDVKTANTNAAVDLTDADWELKIESHGPAVDFDSSAAFYETDGTDLDVGTVKLGLWQDMEIEQAKLDAVGITAEKVANVRTSNSFAGDQSNGAVYLSGVGYYTTTVDWDGSGDGVYLYYDHRDTTGSKTNDAQVNQDMVTQVTVANTDGTTVFSSINQASNVVDLGDALVVGENEITIKLTTTLRNREWLEGYYVNGYTLSSYGLTEAGLVPYSSDPAYKTELRDLYNEYSGLSSEDYTSSSWNAFEEVMEAAAEVLADDSATQTQVDGAYKDLQDAYDNLVQRADKTQLQDLYDEGLNLNESDYTATSWKALEDAMAAADSVLNDTDAIQTQVDAALAALQEAIDELVAAANKTTLQNLYDLWAGRTQDDYTDASWQALQTALARAKTVLDDADATQAQVDAAVDALRAAVNGLEENPPVDQVDKTALQSLYNTWSGRGQGDYTDTSWQALQTALAQAKTVLDNADATQAQVDTALSNLQTAVSGLEENPPVTEVDKAALQSLYNTWSGRDQGDYTDASWQALQTALAQAKTVLDNADATQAQVDTALTNLQATVDGLETKPPVDTEVDKDDLQSYYEEYYEEFEALNPDDYTEDSWAALERALEEAKAVLDDENATQAEVDAALTTLRQAYNGLVETDQETYTVTASANTGGSVTDEVTVAEGRDAVIEVKADEGYKLVAILVDGETVDLSGIENDVYTVEDVRKDMVLRALFVADQEEDFAARFTDVPLTTNGEDTWYYEAVDMLTGLGIIEGTTDTTFEPTRDVKRSEFTKLLFELAEVLGAEPEKVADVPFSDVEDDYWGKSYVGWAFEHEIVEGYNEDEFGPEDSISRQDMALMLQRFFEKYLGYELSGDTELEFTDGAEIAKYAEDAVDFAVRTGLIEGHADGSFGPEDSSLRSQVAQVFYKYLIFQ